MLDAYGSEAGDDEGIPVVFYYSDSDEDMTDHENDIDFSIEDDDEIVV